MFDRRVSPPHPSSGPRRVAPALVAMFTATGLGVGALAAPGEVSTSTAQFVDDYHVRVSIENVRSPVSIRLPWPSSSLSTASTAGG